MPPRSLVASSRRPLSAIFLGSLPPKDPKEANIPDLPEPPESPGAASPSGLPSPPASNSTGSSSTGDSNSANSGSIRQRPVSYSGSPSAMMSTETYDKPIVMYKSSRPNSDDEDDENDHTGEEDITARLDRRIGAKGTSENIAALQRVKSLAQRNRMALDKLSSRLNTPSPTHNSRSPNAPSSSTSSSSRLSHSQSQSAPQVQRNDTLSGSETERESLRAPTPSRSDSHSNSNSYRSSSPERSSTPPSVSNFHQRQRLISAPSSPEKTRQASPGPSRTPRKRVSMASAISAQGIESGRYSRNDHDVTEAALAAVASSRRVPRATKSHDSRFRENLETENDGAWTDGLVTWLSLFRHRLKYCPQRSIEPMTPHRDDGYEDDYSPRTAAHTAVNATSKVQHSPRGARSTRFSTVRDLTRRHQTRWLSDDLSGNAPDSGRRQSQRGGSAESALNGGAGVTGRLAGESLRAAGIGMRGSMRQGAPSNEDVFGDGRNVNVSTRGARSSVAGPSARRTVEWEDQERRRRPDVVDDRSRTSGSNARIGEAVGPPPSRPHLHSDPPRAPSALVVERGDTRGTGHGASSRPATSMADFYHGENDSRNGTYSIRSRRVTYDLSDRPESRHSPTIRTISLVQTPTDPRAGTSSRNRTSVTPVGNSPLVNLNSPHSAEHTRLMLESLSMFKAQLSRLPTQSQAVRDLSDHSSAIIRSSEKLNKILRAATSNSVQQQIAIEVDDEYYEADGPNHPAQIWRDVGSDFRESLRESDDVVRSLTGFILGAGKLLKEVTGAPDPAHLRSISLDDEIPRRPPSDSGVERSSSRRSQDGRRSVESRLSWEPVTSTGGADVSRRLSARSDLSHARPPSSRDRDSVSDQDRSTSSRNGLNPPSASRRLFAPREHREQRMATDESAICNSPSNVFDLSVDHEPSPTPVSRYPQAERSRLPLYSTQPPLPTLPSESLLQRSNTTFDKSNRRNFSLSSITTVRNPNPPFALSTPNPTTAVSIHTASASPETSTFPIERTGSRDSVRSSVTFSRPSGVSVSTLQHQQSRDEARRRAGTTAEEDTSGLNQIRPSLSGSETERDTRPRTLGVREARMSFEAAVVEHETAGGNTQPKTITFPSQRRERRRTVTEIFG
ncbi:hypothetical protein JVT61DRAFT_880 [Boletus reticuloceps]|uniref:Uncharacterized protein n=1 Tax=Boletus reticuloceps TaxID=495285 RepID=A0A8I2YPM0_9AGAM|nr:hypothetical protein JVT61DRAFT_880 [Boletus reticuloceps]